MALSPAVHIVAQRHRTIMLQLSSVLNIVYHSCLRKARESHGTNFQKLIPRDSLFSHEFLRFWHGVFLQFHFPRCNKSPSYRSSQGFMFMRMYVVFLDFVHPALLQFFHFITFGAGNQMDSLQDMMDVLRNGVALFCHVLVIQIPDQLLSSRRYDAAPERNILGSATYWKSFTMRPLIKRNSSFSRCLQSCST